MWRLKVKRIIKKYWWLILLFLFVVFVLPVIIVKLDNDSNVLSYYGGVIGGILAIIGVFFTVQYSQKQYREDQRNSVIPYFAVNMLHTHFEAPTPVYNNGKIGLKNPAPVEPAGYKEYKVTDYYFILDKGKIRAVTGLSENQKKRAHQGGLIRQELSQGVVSVGVANDIYIPITLENVGNGAAINFRIGLNKSGVAYDKALYSQTLSADKGERITVHIYAEDCDEDSKNLGDFELTAKYEDIFGNHYKQTQDIRICFDNETKKAFLQTNMYQKQETLG